MATEDGAQPALEALLAVAEHVAELVFVWTTSGEMLWVNRAFERETGLKIGDFGFDNRDNPFIHPQDLPAVLGALDAFVRSAARSSDPIHNRFIDIWGRTRDLCSSVHKVAWNGRPALLAVASLTSKRGEVAEADESYRQVVESAEDAILKLASDGRIVYSNRRFHRLIGLPIAVIAQRRLGDFVVDEDRPQLAEALARASRGEPRVAFQIGLVTPTGALHRLSVTTTHLTSADGATRCLAILRDVTEAHRIEEALWRQGKLESLSMLAAGIVHDLNNLASAVLANAELAARAVGPDSPVASMLDDIRVAGERAAELNSALLTFIGRAPRAREALRLDLLAQDCARVVRAGIDRNAVLELSAPRPAWVHGDAGQLFQVVLNLFTNAAQALHGQPGSVRAAVDHVALSHAAEGIWFPGPPAAGSYARLCVRDNGVGIGRDVLPKIFDPFFTTKPSGRGLGLAASLGILRSHGGAVRIESQPGRGTTFEVLLPRADVAPDARAPAC